VRLEGLGKLGKFKKCIHLIGPRARDFPTCSVLSQPLRYRMPLADRAPIPSVQISYRVQQSLAQLALEITACDLSDRCVEMTTPFSAQIKNQWNYITHSPTYSYLHGA
jgi:hypothetical protein